MRRTRRQGKVHMILKKVWPHAKIPLCRGPKASRMTWTMEDHLVTCKNCLRKMGMR